MATDDTCCTLVPYFKVHDGKLAEFKALLTTEAQMLSGLIKEAKINID